MAARHFFLGQNMRRRDFFGAAGAMATWPFAALAQDRVRRIGVLMGMVESDSEGRALSSAFREELEKLGWTESRNIRFDTRWTTPDDVQSVQRFAKELVALQPDIILSHVSRTTAALLQETRTIPIIFVIVSDPVGNGFVASFPQPGGNATGFVVTEGSLGSKWLELLKDIAPGVGRAAFMFNPATAPYAGFYLDPFKAAAASLAVDPIVAPIHNRTELEAAIAAMAREPNGGLIVMPDPFMRAHRNEITSLAARYHVPAVYPYRYYTEVGGLLSYGNGQFDNFRRAATYADRILKGAKPGDLPVQAPVKFDLVINLKTAKALGLNIPLHLQQRANEVIE
jgi:putative tryptophan/tyrosine transport system substrate-binding protein